MRRVASILVCGLVVVAASGAGPLVQNAVATAPTFSASETISRTNLDSGADHAVDTRNVKVTVSETQNLRDRQGIDVRWQGAHPTGGLWTDRNASSAAYAEYPVVLMQCRGVDSASAPAAQQVTPSTCWT